ncbi:hypothetical protein LXL04_028471 [Taraxacum kok-saghyz]
MDIADRSLILVRVRVETPLLPPIHSLDDQIEVGFLLLIVDREEEENQEEGWELESKSRTRGDFSRIERIGVLKRRIESIGTKLEHFEPKWELQDFGKKKEFWAADTGRVPRTRVVIRYDEIKLDVNDDEMNDANDGKMNEEPFMEMKAVIVDLLKKGNVWKGKKRKGYETGSFEIAAESQFKGFRNFGPKLENYIFWKEMHQTCGHDSCSETRLDREEEKNQEEGWELESKSRTRGDFSRIERIGVLKRRIESIGTKLEPFEPKLELQDFGKKKEFWAADTGRVPRTRVVIRYDEIKHDVNDDEMNDANDGKMNEEPFMAMKAVIVDLLKKGNVWKGKKRKGYETGPAQKYTEVIFVRKLPKYGYSEWIQIQDIIKNHKEIHAQELKLQWRY